jgi:hypothetical protein
MDGVSHSAPANRKNRITGFVSAFIDAESPATKGEHFGHERQPVELSLLVESSQNFALAPDLDPFPGAQVQILTHFFTHQSYS